MESPLPLNDVRNARVTAKLLATAKHFCQTSFKGHDIALRKNRGGNGKLCGKKYVIFGSPSPETEGVLQNKTKPVLYQTKVQV